jgi:transposase
LFNPSIAPLETSPPALNQFNKRGSWARSFKAHLENILTYFKHRITNAALEGLNNCIASLVKKAFGYRNRERFKTDILFHFGGLSLYPSQ